MSHYVVSFRGGTSGRFISNLLWMMVHDTPFELTFTKENSAHDHSPWCRTWGDHGYRYNDVDVYDFWSFTIPEKGILATHTYPDFDTIRKRMPGSRIILITFNKDDLLEIVTNMIYKNYIEQVRNFIKYNDKKTFISKVSTKDYERFYVTHMKMYGKAMCLDESLIDNREFIDTIIYVKYDHLFNGFEQDEMFKDNQDSLNSDDTLVVKYSDIFKQENESYVVLTQLRKFLNVSTSEETDRAVDTAYKKYVSNRVDFLRNNLPIEKYEDYEKRKNTTLVSRYGWSTS